MDILVSIFVTLAGIGIALLGLDNTAAEKIPLFRNSDPNELFASKEITKVERIIILCVVAILCFVATMKIFDKVSSVLGIIKMLVCLLCLLGAAAFDYREHRIPNAFPATIAIASILLLGLGLLLGEEGAVAYITTGVIASAGCGIILVAAAAITKQGIGAGDIKLICAIALLAGLYTVMGTLFFGVWLCSIYAIIALVLKKKTAKNSVPFGPFLLLGYIMTLVMINF